MYAFRLLLFVASAAVALAQDKVLEAHDIGVVSAPLPGVLKRTEEPRVLLPVGPALGLNYNHENRYDTGLYVRVPTHVPYLSADQVLESVGQVLSGAGVDGAIHNATMRLRATSELHGRVRDHVALLSAVRQQNFKVTLCELPAAAARGRRAVLDGAEVDKLLAEVKPLNVMVTTVTADVPAVIENGRAVHYIADYDVEVAEKSSIADPKSDVLFAGLRLGLNVTPLIDGRIHVLGGLHGTALPKGLGARKLTGAGLGTLHQPEVDCTEISATAVLHAGGALLMAGDPNRNLWLLRVQKLASPPLQFGGTMAVPLGSLAVAEAVAERNIDPIVTPGEDPVTNEPEFAAPDPIAAAGELLGGSIRDSEGTTLFGSHLVVTGQTAMVRRLEQELLAQVKTLRTSAVSIKVGRVNNEMALAHATGQVPAEQLAEALPEPGMVATLVGRRFCITHGREWPFVRDHEVEIASKSAVANPVIGLTFSGWQVAGMLNAPAGALPQLSFRMTYIGTIGREVTDLTEPRLGEVDSPQLPIASAELRVNYEAGKWQVAQIAPDPESPAQQSLVVMVKVD